MKLKSLLESPKLQSFNRVQYYLKHIKRLLPSTFKVYISNNKIIIEID